MAGSKSIQTRFVGITTSTIHLFGSHFCKKSSLFVSMLRLTITPKRLRSRARHCPLVPVGSSSASVKKLCVDMLHGYLASYQLPTTSTKQQLAEHLTHHLRSIAAKKIQRSSGQQKKSRAGAKRHKKTLNLRLRPHANLPHRNPAILNRILGARNFPAESKAAPKVHPAVVAVVAKAGPVGKNRIQGTVADTALTAPHQNKICLVTANPVYPVRSTALGHGSTMQVALMRHR